MINIRVEKLLEYGLDQQRATDLHGQMEAMDANQSSEEAWRHISKNLLTPDDAIKAHEYLWKAAFHNSEGDVAVPCWSPSVTDVQDYRIE